ncbi:YbaB/EbfC family nucleoid-associated protein [Nocardia sp. NPDC003482]
MSNEQLRNDMYTVLDGLRDQMNGIAEAQRRKSEMSARASIHDGRVVVTVDGDGIVTGVEFSDRIDDLSDDEIAAAVTQAAQQAAAEIARRLRDLVRPLLDRRAQWPKLSDLLPGSPDLPEHIPGHSRAPTSPPDAPDRDLDARTAGDFLRASRSAISDDGSH